MSKSIAFLVLFLAMASPGAAQLLPATPLVPVPSLKLDTGLLGFFVTAGREVEVTVTEIVPGAKSRVRITFRDASERTLSTDEGVVERGKPFAHALPVAAAERRTKVRATVLITPLTATLGTPITVLEDIDPLNLTIEPRVICAASLPGPRIDPVLPMCDGGWVPSVIVTP